MSKNKSETKTENKNKYSHTVLLPKTDFPMRAGLAKKEPQTLAYWKEIKLYQKMLDKTSKKEKFILADGPPYANGRIHMGHAFNKILKDIITKSHTMMGYNSPYIPGWDCHGLPIEQALLKEMKLDKRDVKDIPGFRKRAREFAQNFVNIQREGFKRLGVTADWDNPYLTMSNVYEGLTVSAFFDALEKGYVYKGKKAIYWCPNCETALADAETEYHDKVSTSIYLRFKLVNPSEKLKNLEDKPAYLAVWTTTPWTIPANQAAAVAKDEDYRIMAMPDGTCLIAAEKLADNFLKKIGKEATTVNTVKGEDLVGLKYYHPLTNRENPVIYTDFVTMDTGVGIVHIAPGHGEDDFKAGLQWNLPCLCPVDEKGVFTDEAWEFAGQNIFKANPAIIDCLEEIGVLLKKEDITHSYPHCWRCKKPIIFRSTEQWFLSVDKDGLRQKLIEEIKNTKWYPQTGERRITSMVELRPDWCLSRQRFWGVPIMVFYCKECGKMQVQPEVVKAIKERALNEGSDFWFEKSAEEILPEGHTCSCGCKEFIKEKDILDVWFDSGVSWNEVLKYRGLGYPSQVYLEGSDQHRGWFQTSLIAGTVLEGKAPFKNVITHGMILDQQGRAMHKSAGNSIEPDEIINKYGADILRMWVSFTDYSEDVRISQEILAGPIESYRKIRNTLRYALGNLYDFNPMKHTVVGANLTELDKYMMSRLDNLIKEVSEAYKNFEFRKAIRKITDFCILDLSSLMLDASKDRLYTIGEEAPSRRSAQTVLAETVLALVKLLAPVLCFTAEEVWQELRKLSLGTYLEESVFLSDMPTKASYTCPEDVLQRWIKINEIRPQVLKALEEARQKGLIGAPLEAKIIFNSKEAETKEFLKQTLSIWPEVAIVSQAEISEEETEEPLEIKVEHALGTKCARCWQWHEDIGQNPDYPDLCPRCAKVLAENKVLEAVK